MSGKRHIIKTVLDPIQPFIHKEEERGFVWTCPKCSNIYVAPWINECLKCNTKNELVRCGFLETTG